MDLEIRIDGQVAIRADINPAILRATFLGTVIPQGPTGPSKPPKSTPLTVAQVEELFGRIDMRSVQFLKQIAAQNGQITFGETRAIFGIESPTDYAAFSASHGKGITRALRHVLGDKSARLIWWDNNDKAWVSRVSKDPGLFFVDGPALQALRQVAGLAADD